MRINISELGFFYIIQLSFGCIFSCLLSALIGIFGFILFIFTFLCLIFFCFLFRISNTVRTKKNRGLFLSPCDGTLIRTVKSDNGQYTYLFKCGLFDQYSQYVPCDGFLSDIQVLPKTHLQYPNGTMFSFNNQTYGDFQIIVMPGKFSQNRQINVLLESNMHVYAGERISSMSFGSSVILICNFPIDVRICSYVIANSTLFS